jgi:hypothetical protein
MVSKNNDTQSIKIPGLAGQYPKKFTNDIVASAMKIYLKPNLPLATTLKDLIRKKINILNVPDIEKANPGQIKRALEANWMEYPEIQKVVLNAWEDQHQSLIEFCNSLISKLNPIKLRGIIEASALTIRGHIEEEPLELRNMAQEIANQNPRLGSANEILLTIELLIHQRVLESAFGDDVNLGLLSLSQVHSKPLTEHIVSDWEDVLKMIRRIPASDSRWDNFDSFINLTKTIAEKKSKEREQQDNIQKLSDTILKFQEQLASRAGYFQFEGVDNWVAEKTPLELIEPAVNAIYSLQESLHRFEILEDTPLPSTRIERVRLEDERRIAEEQVVREYQFAQNFFDTKPSVQLTDKPNDNSAESSIEAFDNNPGLIYEQQDQSTDTSLETNSNSSNITNKLDDNTIELGAIIDENPDKKGSVLEESSITDLLQTQKNVLPEIIVGASEQLLLEENKSFNTSEVNELPSDLESPKFIQTKISLEESPLSDTIKQNVETPSSGDDANTYLVERLLNHDLSKAYWLAWSLEDQEKDCRIPSKLIAALQGAIWSIGLWPEQPTVFSNSISSLVNPESQQFNLNHEPTRLLMLTAGLYYNLVDPMGGWSNWIGDISSSNTSLEKLTNLILDARTKGILLDSGIVQVVVNAEEIDQHILSLANEARQWLNNSVNKGVKLYRAAQVWQELVRPSKGELYKLIECVANNRRDQIKEIEQQLKNWQNRVWLDKHLQQIDRNLRQKKGNPIVGSPRDQIIGWVEDICDIASKWCNIVKNQEDAKAGHSWKLEQTRLLCDGMTGLINPLRDELAKLNDNKLTPEMSMANSILDWILEGLEAILSSKSLSYLATWPKPHGIEIHENISGQYTLNECLAHALIYYPELDLENSGTPTETASKAVETAITGAINRSSEEAIQEWIIRRDYRFVSSLLSETNNIELWETRVREATRSDASRLSQKEVEETVVAVEQALLEGIIAEGERTEFSSQIESIRKQIRQIERDGFAQISIRKFSDRLRIIREELGEKRQGRLKSHKTHWERLKSDIPQLVGDDNIFFDQIRTVIDSSLTENDLRATGEYLAHLDHALAHGQVPEKLLFEGRSSSETNTLQDFQEMLPNIVSLLEPRSQWSIAKIREAIVKDEALPRIPMNSLPKPRRDEVARTLDAWRRIKSDGSDNTKTHLNFIPDLMNYLGFTLSDHSPISVKNLPGGFPNFQYWRVSASANDFSPVAQFGSQREGYYDVLGAWERSGFETISAQVSSLMQQTGNRPTILFYFHYLTPAKRESLLNHTRKYSLPMLVIDEALILYLAREHDARIRPMFQCALPYTTLNPYFPAAAGKVPPEVYKGRHDLVRKLIDPFGPAIVYGGRQLGKSALLRQVEREFHHPENGQYVIYDDIKSVGDPVSGKNYQSEFRDRFAQALINLKLIEPQRNTMDLDRLLNYLEQQVLIKGKRLLFLLDEADHFLDADASKNFYIVQKLKSLMDQSNRNFKIVLAGLHNVQRFQRISNQPLAHLGTPIEIGPLEPKAARDLLVDPLHALGYRFGPMGGKEDNSLVLHILSYTNYHPGLIQLFGSYLYEHLHSNYEHSNHLPLSITRTDVEAVYRKKEVRDEICKRFNWTLALDPRYEAITLALIIEQLDDQNGFDRLFTPKELRDLTSSWWPDAFAEEITPERFKSFLDEMRGLGVLSVSSDGNNYRLRSPNLVYLMGTYEEICDKLDSLSRTIPPGERAMDSYHAQIEIGEYSPLTFANERALNNLRSGVALIFGSAATGVNNLDNALKRLLPEETGIEKEIRIASHSFEAIQQQLKIFVKENPKANFLIAYRRLDCDSVKMADEVSGAVKYCKQIGGRTTLRVIFGLDPHAAWQWHQIPLEQREALEEQVEVNLSLKRWDRVGVKQRLEMESGDGKEIIISDRLLSQVIDITGGWPDLLDEFIKNCHKNEPSRSLELIKNNLSDHQSDICRSLINSIGIYDQFPQKLIHILKQDDIQELLKENSSYLEVLQLVMENFSQDSIENTVEYLRRLSVINKEPYLSLESAFARAWYVS